MYFLREVFPSYMMVAVSDILDNSIVNYGVTITLREIFKFRRVRLASSNPNEVTLPPFHHL